LLLSLFLLFFSRLPNHLNVLGFFPFFFVQVSFPFLRKTSRLIPRALFFRTCPGRFHCLLCFAMGPNPSVTIFHPFLKSPPVPPCCPLPELTLFRKMLTFFFHSQIHRPPLTTSARFSNDLPFSYRPFFPPPPPCLYWWTISFFFFKNCDDTPFAEFLLFSSTFSSCFPRFIKAHRDLLYWTSPVPPPPSLLEAIGLNSHAPPPLTPLPGPFELPFCHVLLSRSPN